MSRTIPWQRYLNTALFALLSASPMISQTQAPSTPPTLQIDAHGVSTPFPHYWETTFGSGRAILTLRDSYRKDLRSVKEITGMREVRFHGIFMDEVGLYDPARRPIQFAQMKDAQASAANAASPYNFSYIDQIYDGLLDEGVRPFVELSFMPRKMASDPNALHPFWYHQNVSPPKDYAAWDTMIEAFARHLVERYGIEEVAQWHFEVWNEPNIDFWAGSPKQETYFTLYDHTALALKKVSQRLRVGGPATAQAAWVGDFLRHCKDKNIPVDFTSSHVYANDTAKDVMHSDEQIPRDRMVCRSVRKVHDEITSSPLPNTPLIFSEYNASYANEPNVTDSVYMGPWLATTISQCDGMAESLAYWTFSDVFEEQGVLQTPFYGGFGIVAEHGIQKPAFHAFAMLHQLGDRRLKLDSDSALATVRADGSIVVALWNYAAPDGTGADYTRPPATRGPAKSFTLSLTNVPGNAAATLQRLDEDHGNVIKSFDAMGRPATPSRKQIAELREAGKAAPAEKIQLHNGRLSVSIPPQGLVLITIPGRKAAR